MIDVVRQHLAYDAETGVVSYATASHVRNVGDRAGYPDKDGYIRVSIKRHGIKRRAILAHHVAWILVFGRLPPKGHDIDHINGNRSDNRMSNLRECNRRQNIANAHKSRNPTSGFKGVTRNNSKGRWIARIRLRAGAPSGKHLGMFDTPEEAHAAYCRAARDLYGDFARSE